jgi:hypothetical protein
MKVKELIERLKLMPPNADVWHLWDGEVRTEIERVWLARSGDVITSDVGMICYSSETRPVISPKSDEDPYWQGPQGED